MLKKITSPLLSGLIIFLLLSVPEALHARDVDSLQSVVSVETGYATFELPYLKQSLEQEIMGMVVRYNLRLKKLNDYPDNLYLGAAVTFRASESVWIDIGGWYTQTKGAIGYRDLKGRVSEDMRLHIIFAKAGFQADVFHSDNVTWYAAMHGGLLTTKLNINDKIEFYELSDYNAASDAQIRSYYFAADLALGARTLVYGAVVSLECGYRTNTENREGDLSDSFDGWNIAARLGIPLSWQSMREK